MNTDSQEITSYYHNNGKRIPLPADSTVFAVGFRNGRKADDRGLSALAKRLLNDDSEALAFVPHYNLRVYALKTPANAISKVGDRFLTNVIQSISSEEPIEFAAQAIQRMDGEGNLSFVSKRFLVSFLDGVGQTSINQLHQVHGVQVVERLGYVKNGYLLEAPSAQGLTGSVALSNLYYETGLCDFAHPDFVERRQWRGLVSVQMETLPLQSASARDIDFLDRQWHLRSAKIEDAWNISRGNPEITVAVLDDGVDVGHPEFLGKVKAQFDFQNNSADGSPKSADDKHGTSCAGVAVAAGVKASGVAPGCQLMAVRTPSLLGVAQEANMFKWAADNGADVISCSWGPPDNAGAFSLVDNVRSAIHYATTQGRSGKGIPIFFAAGNGNESISNDGYASNPDVMAVAACSEHDLRAPYSDFGPEVFIAAPSSGNDAAGDRRVFTTDRRGTSGYNAGDANRGDAAGDYTSRFGGTSSASPLVAGVAALVLSVQPALTRDQVRGILQRSADKIGAANDYDASGHSQSFGFGRVNAVAAVQMAQPQAGNLGLPTITGPRNADPGSIPNFAVNRGNRALYAVELAVRRELLDPANAAQRTDSNHFGSWSEGLRSDANYKPPLEAWTKLCAASPDIFYLGHFADDAQWSNYLVSSTPANAPSISIGASANQTDGAVSLSTAATSDLNTPPLFEAQLGTHLLFAVELATSPELFDPANASQRTGANHYGSWVEGLKSAGSYLVPVAIWRGIAQAGRVYYRGHFADDANWSHYALWPATGSPPFVEIAGQSPSNPSPVKTSELRFPSGAVFQSVENPEGSIDYSDPVAGGVIPLIDTRGQENQRLSANFLLKELMAPSARYARIAPKLVEVLQTLRSQLGSGLKVESGYRHPALNQSAGGEPNSEHLTGRAATVRAVNASVKPLDLAKIVLESVTEDLGLGLGTNSLHIAVNGTFSTWVYDGAALSDDQFATFAREHRSVRMVRNPRLEIGTRLKPTIDGPSLMSANHGAPAFRITSRLNRYCAIEVASHWSLFSGETQRRNADNFYASWADPEHGLLECQPNCALVFELPSKSWQALRNSEHLYYRAITSAQNNGKWEEVSFSTSDDEAVDAPFVLIKGNVTRSRLETSVGTVFSPHSTDDQAWSR